jgi:hypothetical protein
MLNKITKTKIITGLLLASIVVSTSVTVLASESTNTSGTNNAPAYGEKFKEAKRFKHNFSADNLKKELDPLVKDGTINEVQATQIVDYFKAKEAEWKVEKEKIKNMTEAQRKTYFEQKKSSGRPDVFKDLVEKNIVNQTQADAIKKVLPYHKKKMHVNFKEKLSSAVKNGTITQAQADKINSYLETKKAERKAEIEKARSMTEEQRKTYFQQKKSSDKPDLFKDLVEQKIVSQSEADALKKLFFPEGKKEFRSFKR